MGEGIEGIRIFYFIFVFSRIFKLGSRGVKLGVILLLLFLVIIWGRCVLLFLKLGVGICEVGGFGFKGDIIF